MRLVDGPSRHGGAQPQHLLARACHRARADRWCAFARPLAAGGAELWVINVAPRAGRRSQLRRQQPALPAADHRAVDRRAAAVPPGHPSVHAFFGDTLIFYARSATGNSDDELPRARSRPGDRERPPRRCSPATRGGSASGHERSAGLICLDSGAHRSAASWSSTCWPAPSARRPAQPLPRIDDHPPASTTDGDLLWQVGFSPSGSLPGLFRSGPRGRRRWSGCASSPPPSWAGARRRRCCATSPPGSFRRRAPAVLPARLQLRAGEIVAGHARRWPTFPAGTNARELQPRVGRFELYGNAGQPARAVGIYQELQGLQGRFSLMADPARPAELTCWETPSRKW